MMFNNHRKYLLPDISIVLLLNIILFYRGTITVYKNVLDPINLLTVLTWLTEHVEIYVGYSLTYKTNDNYVIVCILNLSNKRNSRISLLKR